MKNFKISQHLINSYLTAGNAPDNSVIRNCENDFLKFVQNSLQNNEGNAKACLVTFNQDDINVIQKLYSELKKDLQKNIVARSYVWTKIALSILDNFENPKARRQLDKIQIEQCLNIFKNGNLQQFIDNISSFPNFMLVESYIRDGNDQINILNKPIELDIFLYNMDDILIQQNINDILGGRTKAFYLKVFTNQSNFCTRLSSNDSYLQAPHDYRDITSLFESLTVANENQNEC